MKQETTWIFVMECPGFVLVEETTSRHELKINLIMLRYGVMFWDFMRVTTYFQ